MQVGGVISANVTYSGQSFAQYYTFATIFGMILALISILLNFIRVVESFKKIPWNFCVNLKKIFFIRFIIMKILISLLIKGINC